VEREVFLSSFGFTPQDGSIGLRRIGGVSESPSG